MRLVEIRLPQELDKSFVYYHDKNNFAPWHNHPEYELTLIVKGKGKRMIGDSIDRFEENDLLLIGPYLPHEWLCDDEYLNHPNGFQGECIVILFEANFLGTDFYKLPENIHLQKVLSIANRGCRIKNRTSEEVIKILLHSVQMSNNERLYALISIFGILSKMPASDCESLASANFSTTFTSNINEPINRVTHYILQNFQKEITIKSLLEISNMSNTTFSMVFKKTFRMTFKEYLESIRIGYACKLLNEDRSNISEIAYRSGFQNISNFNRQFKRIKGVTPSQFKSTIENF